MTLTNSIDVAGAQRSINERHEFASPMTTKSTARFFQFLRVKLEIVNDYL
jgi:hypothetical protein